MKARIPLIIALLFFTSLTFSQRKEIITVHLKDGSVASMEFKLRDYLGKLIFPDDSKKFIEGKDKKGEKVRIDKSKIKEIELRSGFKYEVIEDSEGTYIGYYVAKGEFNVFESYPYDRSTFYGATGPSTTINKTASLAHYRVVDGKVGPLYTKKKLKELSSECEALAGQLVINKDLKEKRNVGEAFSFYNEACIDNPVVAPCVLVVFRRKKGQSEDPVKFSIDGKSYEFLINDMDTIRLANYRNVELCIVGQSNCQEKIFNSNRFNYVEVSKSKKDQTTKIEYVEKTYGEYQANQIIYKTKK